MQPIILIYIAFGLLLTGAIIAAITSKAVQVCSWVSLGFVSASAICLIYLSIYVFIKGSLIAPEPLLTLPEIGSSLIVGVNALSALFLMITGIISFCVTLFSIRYVTIYKKETLLRYYPLLLSLFASIVALVVTRDMLFFIFFWEFMTVTSWALVVFERENSISLRAGLLYFITTHAATALIVIASLILYSHSPGLSFSFDELRAGFNTLLTTNPVLVHFILALYLIGFCTKAGILPFGFWLPEAYPAPPSSVSAAFAGTLSKLGVYGIIVVFCVLLPVSSFMQTWGVVIAILGGISILVCTMSAVNQDDFRKLMSFHVIGQVGYMFLGIGIGIFFLPTNQLIALIALVGGLFHLLNHTIYMSCLFLNAGSIFYKTDNSDLNKVGGLFVIMPMTGLTAIIASLAISGIPPFNGFVSKLIIFESSIIAGTAGMGAAVWARVVFIILGLIALFISVVTLASFLKFINSAFMGKLRGLKEYAVGDVPMSMKISQIILALLCIILGLFPLLPVTIVYKAINSALPAGASISLATLFGNTWLGLNINFGGPVIAGVLNFIWILIVFGVILGLIYLIILAGKARTRIVETWYGGKEHISEDISYRGHSFYRPFKQVFSFSIRGTEFRGLYPVALPVPKIRMPKAFWFLFDLDQWVYHPLVNIFMKFNRIFSRSHTGLPQMYLLWITLGVIAVLAIVLGLHLG